MGLEVHGRAATPLTARLRLRSSQRTTTITITGTAASNGPIKNKTTNKHMHNHMHRQGKKMCTSKAHEPTHRGLAHRPSGMPVRGKRANADTAAAHSRSRQILETKSRLAAATRSARVLRCLLVRERPVSSDRHHLLASFPRFPVSSWLLVHLSLRSSLLVHLLARMRRWPPCPALCCCQWLPLLLESARALVSALLKSSRTRILSLEQSVWMTLLRTQQCWCWCWCCCCCCCCHSS